jgi:tetratricopeptide (TPR) repeat protein
MADWYGPGHRAHYGSILARGRNGDPDAREELISLAGDLLYPVNVRATALSLLAAYSGDDVQQAFEKALVDEEALVRNAAVMHIDAATPQQLAGLLAPLLYDPVRTVRIEAARRLAGDTTRFLHPDYKQQFDRAFDELEASLLYTADFAASRHNLGNLYARLGRPEDAARQYEQALKIDRQFYPAAANLAVLYSQQGRNREAEQLLRSALEQQPNLYDVAYSLGLLLVELQEYDEALVYLERAAAGLPGQSRIHYNLGLLYQFLGRLDRAESSLAAALALEPDSLDYQYALADHYIKTGRFDEARPIAEKMMATHPEEPVGRQMLEFILRNSGRQ